MRRKFFVGAAFQLLLARFPQVMLWRAQLAIKWFQLFQWCQVWPVGIEQAGIERLFFLGQRTVYAAGTGIDLFGFTTTVGIRNRCRSDDNMELLSYKDRKFKTRRSAGFLPDS